MSRCGRGLFKDGENGVNLRVVIAQTQEGFRLIWWLNQRFLLETIFWKMVAILIRWLVESGPSKQWVLRAVYLKTRQGLLSHTSIPIQYTGRKQSWFGSDCLLIEAASQTFGISSIFGLQRQDQFCSSSGHCVRSLFRGWPKLPSYRSESYQTNTGSSYFTDPRLILFVLTGLISIQPN